jgi:hypothetical protein
MRQACALAGTMVKNFCDCGHIAMRQMAFLRQFGRKNESFAGTCVQLELVQ